MKSKATGTITQIASSTHVRGSRSKARRDGADGG
jgi:hypothetical protein